MHSLSGGLMERERLEMAQLATDFLSQNTNEKKLKNMLGRQSRLSVNLDDLRRFNERLADFVLRHPIEAIKIFED